MPVAHNMDELERMLQKELRRAMTVTAKKILADMYQETGEFYAGGEPKQYERTGALGDTPKTTALSVNGNEISFQAYLDTQHQYTTGKNPTMLQVLRLTENLMTHQPEIGYLRRAKGSPHFWNRAIERMKRTYNDVLNSFFTRM